MLRAIQLTNFQCHSSKVIHFDPAVTVLVGANGIGKSAVIRALEWVCFNSWEGKADGFITWGRDFSTVKLWTDKHVIRRHKSNTDNLYTLDGVDIRFDSVNRRSVPEPIRKVIKLSIDNFQGQLDSAFWFSLTPGEVVRSLNSIVNLEEIDASLARAGSRLREARTREKIAQERLEAAQTAKASLAWTVQAHKSMCTIEQVHARIGSVSARIDAAEGCIAKIKKADRVRVHALALVARGQAVLDLQQRVLLSLRRASAVQSCLDRIENLASRRDEIEQCIIGRRQEISELQERVDICPTCKRPL